MEAPILKMTREEIGAMVEQLTEGREWIINRELNEGGNKRTAMVIGYKLRQLGFYPRGARKGDKVFRVWVRDSKAQTAQWLKEIHAREADIIRLKSRDHPRKGDWIFKDVVEYAATHKGFSVDNVIRDLKLGTTNGEKPRIKKILDGLGLTSQEIRAVVYNV